MKANEEQWLVQYDVLYFDLKERTITEEIAGTTTDLDNFINHIKSNNAYNIIITEV